MGPTRLLSLAAWKGLLKLRHRWDVTVGNRLAEGRVREWRDAWLKEWGSDGAGAWLRRPGAGRLWVDVEQAQEWCRASCTADDLTLARQALEGVFDILGSGPVELGVTPRWRTDLYSGVEWPLDPADPSRLETSAGSDIRTVWELGRGYHFPALARAYHTTGDRRFADAFARHVESWIAQNPLGFGPNWLSPMDTAIRAANWALATVLFADCDTLPAPFWARLLGQLRLDARFIERYREWHPLYRGNHYVANGVGLVYVGGLFGDVREGRRWLVRGGRLLGGEILTQVLPDGVGFEASLAYHRLVTEFFTWGGEVLKRNRPGLWGPAQEERLRGMYAFIEAYTPASGEAPMMGDADDGRLHVLEARALHAPREHRRGLPPEMFPEGPPISRLYREGGFAVIRDGRDHCVVRCGPVGLRGAGSHDHNDQTSFELVADGERIIRDSGTYCYTRDLDARHWFRSTAAHSVVQIGTEEQNPIHVARPWRVLADRTRSRVVAWDPDPPGPEVIVEHTGFQHLPGSPVVRRSIRFDSATRSWTVGDEVLGEGVQEVTWRLQLELPPRSPRITGGSVEFHVGGSLIRVGFPGRMVAQFLDTWSSVRYGAREKRPVLVVKGFVPLPLEIRTDVGSAAHAPSSGGAGSRRQITGSG